MDLNEMNLWIATDEGAAWLESQKQPLLNKRDELLKEISDQRSAVSNSNAKITEYEKSLSEERAVIEKFVVDNELQALLQKAAVFDGLIPDVIKSLKNAYGITVNASGNDRKAMGKIKDTDGNEKEVDLPGIVENWKMKPENKALQACLSNGGGATGSFSKNPIKVELNPNSGRQLVNTSDQDFNQWRQKELEKAKENNL